MPTPQHRHDFVMHQALTPSLPSQQSDLIDRGITPDDVRHAVLDKLISNRFTDHQELCIAPLMKVVGLGDLEPSFKGIWKFFDQYNHTHVKRELVLACIFHTAYGHSEFAKLSDKEKIDLGDPWIAPMVKLSQNEVFPRQALKALYASTHNDLRPYLIDKIERLRKHFNVSTEKCYECFDMNKITLPF